MQPLSRFLVWIVSIAALASGCALKPVKVTSKENSGGQSETSFAMSRFGDVARLTVTYNDGTDQAAVQYTATTRVAKKGATHLGWSNSNDYGASWSYGGRVAPSDAWPILWGDPGITHSVRDQHYVYIVSLAIPKAKLDAAPGGEISGPVNDYIGGACIARSVNGGQTFSLYQCVQTTEADSTGDFYDGGNMASDTQGNIYAGWVNVDRSAVHIWRAVGENGTFQKLANPFGASTMVSHPRLRVNLETNELFVMAIDINGELLLARWNGSSWGGTWHTGMFAQSYPCIVASGALCGSSPVVRTGPQFSFDIGSFGKANDHIRMMFTRYSSLNGRLFIAGAGCMLGNQNCQYIPEWGTGEGDKDKVNASYNPLVRAFRSTEMASKGEPSLWMGSHTTYHPATGRVSFGMGGLGMFEDQNGQDLFIHLAIFQLANQILCADLRGYWGDYDDLQALGPVPGRTSNVFARTLTDSSQGCDYRWQYTSSQVHVSFTGN
jgi:hypothetical protein